MRFTKSIAGFAGSISVVAVVSAFAGETDRLLGTVEEYRNANAEAIARVVATGEEVATAFLTLELDRFGIPAQVLDPGQIQLIAETGSNDTEPVSADIAVIENVLQQGRVAVIPGFVARDRSGRVALFGRGGSDLSALFLAKQLNARCRLIKDVDGIYNSDPADHSDAQRFDEINFTDALRSPARSSSRKLSRSAERPAYPSKSPLSARITPPSSAAIAQCSHQKASRLRLSASGF